MPSVQKPLNAAVSRIGSSSNASLRYMKQNARKFSLVLTEALDKEAASGVAQKAAQKLIGTDFNTEIQVAYKTLSAACGRKINKLF